MSEYTSSFPCRASNGSLDHVHATTKDGRRLRTKQYIRRLVIGLLCQFRNASSRRCACHPILPVDLQMLVEYCFGVGTSIEVVIYFRRVLLFANHHFQFKWIVVFAVGCVTLSMIDSSILCRLSRVVYASFSPDQLPSNSNSSLGPPSSTEKPRTQSHELVDTIVDAHELTAQVRHLKPLLQTQVKYVHTPLIQVVVRKTP
ncbi:hypothetical protein RB195_023623 [Necator americanus]|uniref:Uncharacterized protein n=1 Tax=Necator americanus TaxID=51031 RepID=A0ABR1EK07_NECAM